MVYLFPKLFGVFTAKLFIHQQQSPFLLREKNPKTQINQKAIFQYVNFYIFTTYQKQDAYQSTANKVNMHEATCICSLFAHYLS